MKKRTTFIITITLAFALIVSSVAASFAASGTKKMTLYTEVIKSGKSVTPKVYLAVGISGAAHHVAGMSKSGKIISINRDKNAKIFEISDYKVVGDSNAIMAALAQKLQ